jgi:hypothetical protein
MPSGVSERLEREIAVVTHIQHALKREYALALRGRQRLEHEFACAPRVGELVERALAVSAPSRTVASHSPTALSHSQIVRNDSLVCGWEEGSQQHVPTDTKPAGVAPTVVKTAGRKPMRLWR